MRSTGRAAKGPYPANQLMLSLGEPPRQPEHTVRTTRNRPDKAANLGVP